MKQCADDILQTLRDMLRVDEHSFKLTKRKWEETKRLRGLEKIVTPHDKFVECSIMNRKYKSR